MSRSDQRRPSRPRPALRVIRGGDAQDSPSDGDPPPQPDGSEDGRPDGAAAPKAAPEAAAASGSEPAAAATTSGPAGTGTEARSAEVRAAFIDFLKEHLGFLFRYLARFGFRREDLEDVVQSSVCGAYQNLHRFDPSRGQLRGWLAGIADRQAIVFRLRARRRPDRVHGAAVIDQAAGDGPAPDEGVIAGDRLHILEELLGGVAEERLEVILARDAFGMEFADIAAELGLPESTVQSRYRHGRKDVQQATARWQAARRRRGEDILPVALALLLGDRDALAAGMDQGRKRLLRRAKRGLVAMAAAVAVALTVGIGAALAPAEDGRDPPAVARTMPAWGVRTAGVSSAEAPAHSAQAQAVPAESPRAKPQPRSARAGSAASAATRSQQTTQSEEDADASSLLMDMARAAVASGNFAEARILFERHRQDFPCGPHTAEREAYLSLLRRNEKKEGP